MRDQNKIAINEVRTITVIFSFFHILFLPVDTLWAPLSVFLLLFLLSGFPASDFLSLSSSPHLNLFFELTLQTWSCLGHFLF